MQGKPTALFKGQNLKLPCLLFSVNREFEASQIPNAKFCFYLAVAILALNWHVLIRDHVSWSLEPNLLNILMNIHIGYVGILSLTVHANAK